MDYYLRIQYIYNQCSSDEQRVPCLPVSDIDSLSYNEFHTLNLLNLVLVGFYSAYIQVDSLRMTYS